MLTPPNTHTQITHRQPRTVDSQELLQQLQGIAMHILLPTPLVDFQASEMRLVSSYEEPDSRKT